MSTNLVHRFRRWVIVAIAFGAAFYLGYTIWIGFDEVKTQFAIFKWVWFIPVLLLTLLNYGLRFAKWHYLLGRLGVDMPLREDAWNFAAGLAMVISPAKAGEMLKPYVVNARLGTPMSRTIPALVTERLTDAIAMLILAGLSVSTYAAQHDAIRTEALAIPAGLILVGLVVVAIPTLSMAVFRILEQVPIVKKVVPKLRELYDAMRTCASPVPLLLTIFLSIIAWAAECLGYLLVFYGLGVKVTFDSAVFLYAFATIGGAATGSPGGLGPTEAMMVEMAPRLMAGVTPEQSIAAAIIIRVATLWLGVGLGAFALFKISALLGGEIQLGETSDSSAESSKEET
ncbi:MAG: lysylphosphatidylglycerol synthase transmembrane domain-containing protein [Myxococcota bacterium]|nr:lysylphosphatidylglycerol synthase transmembrane domain-containing protein [Myxococcota bacterium]